MLYQVLLIFYQIRMRTKTLLNSTVHIGIFDAPIGSGIIKELTENHFSSTNCPKNVSSRLEKIGELQPLMQPWWPLFDLILASCSVTSLGWRQLGGDRRGST